MVNPHITVVGLGPGDTDLLTVGARQALDAAVASGALVLRTRVHPTVDALTGLSATESYDHLYEVASDFEEVYATIVADLIRRAHQTGAITYAVPGHPTIGEATVSRLRREAPIAGVTVTILPGLSFVDAISPLLNVDIGDGAHICDALAIGQIDPTVPLLICQMHSRRVAASVKIALGAHYPDTHEVVMIRAAGVAGQEKTTKLALWELDRRDDVDHLTTLWVPPLTRLDAVREPATLLAVMARLRAPDGCPWDREQTHASLRRFLLEETYEALEALDRDDAVGLEEELGDILLQVAFHSQIGEETGAFTFGDVVAGIVTKMVRRHPHVFSDATASTSQEVLVAWEAGKRAERQASSARKSMLDGVPRSLPALAQSQAVQDRAARVGFDWPDIAGVLDKIVEETREVAEATRADQPGEIGDVLFVTVNLARHLGIDAEEALREAIAKFRRRFGHIEASVGAMGVEWSTLDAPALDRMWIAAKIATDQPNRS